MTSPLLGIAINDALIFSTKSFCLSYLDNRRAVSHWWAGCAAGAAQERNFKQFLGLQSTLWIVVPSGCAQKFLKDICSSSNRFDKDSNADSGHWKANE